MDRRRLPAAVSAFTAAVGMSMHAMIGRHGVPGLPDQNPEAWTVVYMAVWAVLAAPTALWPPETSRPWPRFTRRCRDAVSRALADESFETGFRVSRAVFSEPGRRKGKSGAGQRRPSQSLRSRKGLGDVDDHIDDLADMDTYGGGDGGDSGGGD